MDNYFKRLEEWQERQDLRAWCVQQIASSVYVSTFEALRSPMFEPFCIITHNYGFIMPVKGVDNPLRLAMVDDVQLPLQDNSVKSCVFLYTLEFSGFKDAEKIVEEAMRVSRDAIALFFSMPLLDHAVKVVLDKTRPDRELFQYSRGWLRTRLGTFLTRQEGEDTIAIKFLNQ